MSQLTRINQAQPFYVSPLNADMLPTTANHYSTSAGDFGPNTMLLHETRETNIEIRRRLGEILTKMDRVLEKVADLDPLNNDVRRSYSECDANGMQYTALRQENEKLKMELFEKSNIILALNDTVSLLNQMQSQEKLTLSMDAKNELSLAEQRAKIKQLQQENVDLKNEQRISSVQAKRLELELNELRDRETSLQQQLNVAEANDRSSRQQLEAARQQINESEAMLELLESRVKEEHSGRKEIERKVSQLEHHVTELKASKEIMEQNLEMAKVKFLSELSTRAEETETLKLTYQKEIASMKENAHKQRRMVEEKAEERVGQLEMNLNREWQEKCDRLTSDLKKEHHKSVKELQEDGLRMKKKILLLQQKVKDVTSQLVDEAGQTESLKEQVEEIKFLKSKYMAMKKEAMAKKKKVPTATMS